MDVALKHLPTAKGSRCSQKMRSCLMLTGCASCGSMPSTIRIPRLASASAFICTLQETCKHIVFYGCVTRAGWGYHNVLEAPKKALDVMSHVHVLGQG